MDRRDACGLAGLCLVALGGWLSYEPLAALLPGLILVGVAVFGVR